MKRTFSAFAFAALIIACSMAQAGPISPLYLSTGTQIQVIQGASVVDSWATGDQEYSIAVDQTVRTWSQGATVLSPVGREYLLDGTPTGVTYLNTIGCCFRDGTTDGQFNYAIRQQPGSNAIYRFNLDWTDPQVLTFAAQQLVSPINGIAYDSSDDTFWLAAASAFNVVTVLHVTRTGAFISAFSGGTGNANVSLAYDRADDTLWLYSPLPSASELRQYAALDTAGPNFPLSTQPGIGFVAAIEFQLQQSAAAVSEPATAGLLVLGLGVILMRLRAR